MNYLIKNGTLLLRKDGRYVTEKKDLFVRDGKISFSAVPEQGESFETIDASGKLVMPGLINTHGHLYMTVMRNYADDVDFGEWLFGRIMPVEDGMPAEAAYWSAQLGCIEMIQTGTTCFSDMHMFEGQSARVARDAGMRAFIGRGLVGDDLYSDGLGRFEEMKREMAEYGSELVKFVVSPHAIYSCSPKFYTQAAEAAKELGLLKQTHLSESDTEVSDSFKKYGMSPVKLLAGTGFLDDETVLAHCVKLSEDDIEILAGTGASAATNPASNAKLGNGIAPVTELLEAGVNVCIGTDSTASNNTLNMFREMGLLSLMHKAVRGSSVAMSAQQVLTMALNNAAKALHMEGSIGEIKEDACADLIFVDLNAVSLFPNNNIISSLCYSANGSEVESVMINGRFVMRNRELLTVDRERVIYEVNKISSSGLLKGE